MTAVTFWKNQLLNVYYKKSVPLVMLIYAKPGIDAATIVSGDGTTPCKLLEQAIKSWR